MKQVHALIDAHACDTHAWNVRLQAHASRMKRSSANMDAQNKKAFDQRSKAFPFSLLYWPSD
jgi:hypothetical protein